MLSGLWCRSGVTVLTRLKQRVSAVGVTTSAPVLAARKGTREKRKKAKVKKEEVKKVFVPNYLRKIQAAQGERKQRRVDDSHLPLPTDNVYDISLHRKQVWPLSQALETQRQWLSPSVLNRPTADLRVLVELDLRMAKKTRFIDPFTRVVRLPHWTCEPPKQVMAFCRNPETCEAAMKAGAAMAGSVELVKSAQTGKTDLAMFDHVVCHPDSLTDIVALRGLLRRRFPNPRNGNLGADVVGMLDRFMYGAEYKSNQDDMEKDFGWVEVTVGTADMDADKVEANIKALLRDMAEVRPPRPGPFFTRLLLLASPSTEQLPVDLRPMLPKAEMDAIESGEKSDEEEREKEEGEDKEEGEKEAAKSHS